MMNALMVAMSLILSVSPMNLKRGVIDNDHTYCLSGDFNFNSFEYPYKENSSGLLSPDFFAQSPHAEEYENSAGLASNGQDEYQLSILRCLENFINRIFPVSETETTMEFVPPTRTFERFHSEPTLKFDIQYYNDNTDLPFGIANVPMSEILDCRKPLKLIDPLPDTDTDTDIDIDVEMSDSESTNTDEITEEEKVLGPTQLGTLYSRLFREEDVHSFDSYISGYDKSG